MKLGWLKVRLSVMIVDNQNVPGDTKAVEAVYTVFKSSTGIWSMMITPVIVDEAGSLATSLGFEVSGSEAYVSCSSGVLTNAWVSLMLDYQLTHDEIGAFLR